ncbi:peptidoglycan/LPS O-acetylase OafA/YrhL [Mycobacterium frederiksbergense]|jgi:hypothetical protein|uniref:Peptidoglycan/LPS O-acetylase OafA/YrhL n=1 Tax=Mycolicibacterium frederiksbergense TaxID=117567 RepID=A0ABT6L782_9MYCO|nr:hypothetical protein [Mycolicibacterium frederiksbergense]MDH6198753.1 peptidoglycan/LPS O-acetylase OafA/YrhL [Mycolicibacterium frederiksbergense]
MSSSPAPKRPLVATVGFFFWLVASVLLIVGGMIAASVSLPGLDTVLFRGTGVLTALAGLGMAFLAGRSRTGDPRYRRAAIALSLAIVVIVALIARFGLVHILTLLGLVLLVVGTGLNALPLRRGEIDE